MTDTAADVLIIGAGIAGASLAWRLGGHGLRVTLLDMEDRAGYHATGRSAAMYEPRFGPPVIRALTVASAPFFLNPPDGFCHTPLSAPRGTLMAGEVGDDALIADALAMGFEPISLVQAKRLLPPLRIEALTSCLYDPETRDLDVDALHQACLRAHKRQGGALVLNAELQSASRQNGVWHVVSKAGEFTSPILVNASGAWADIAASRCGVKPLGFTPKRRSMAVITAPEDAGAWPQIFPAREDFYAKPAGGKLLVSPSDADPAEPHDAFADDMRLAEGIEAFQRLMDVDVDRLDSSWGGLRTFAPDGDPVVGYDTQMDGFFWLAGQGGYGIQTMPALSEFAAALLLKQDLPDFISRDTLRPDR
jgi:D-arginine dehydrogenase